MVLFPTEPSIISIDSLLNLGRPRAHWQCSVGVIGIILYTIYYIWRGIYHLSARLLYMLLYMRLLYTGLIYPSIIYKINTSFCAAPFNSCTVVVVLVFILLYIYMAKSYTSLTPVVWLVTTQSFLVARSSPSHYTTLVGRSFTSHL